MVEGKQEPKYLLFEGARYKVINERVEKGYRCIRIKDDSQFFAV